MNNEEKILEMLGQVIGRLDRLETTQTEMQATLTDHGKALTEMQATLTDHGKALTEMQATLTDHGKALTEMQATLTDHDATLERLEERIEVLDERSRRSAVLLEGDIAPKVQLLFEGQKNLLDTLAPKDRMEVLEDEVITLKTMMKSMSKRLAALERAQ